MTPSGCSDFGIINLSTNNSIQLELLALSEYVWIQCHGKKTLFIGQMHKWWTLTPTHHWASPGYDIHDVASYLYFQTFWGGLMWWLGEWTGSHVSLVHFPHILCDRRQITQYPCTYVYPSAKWVRMDQNFTGVLQGLIYYFLGCKVLRKHHY